MDEAYAVEEAEAARRRRWSKPTAALAQAVEAAAARRRRWSKPRAAPAQAVEAALALWRRRWLTPLTVLPAEAAETAPASCNNGHPGRCTRGIMF